MENLRILNLLESNTNVLYELKVSNEIFARASCDMLFATYLLNERIDHGIEVFNMPVEDLKFSTIPKEEYCSSSAGPSTVRKNEKCFLETYENKKTSDVFNWTKEEVLLLIATYKEHQLLFLDESFPKSEAWEKVIHEMTLIRAGQGLPKIDTKKCKTKMEALRRHYKKIKDASNKSGAQKITWPYYDEMEDLFSEQPWVKPISTAGSNIVDDIEAVHPPSKRQKTLKDFCEELAIERKKRGDIRSQEHREKIDAVNRLTDVVAQLVANIGKKN